MYYTFLLHLVYFICYLNKWIKHKKGYREYKRCLKYQYQTDIKWVIITVYNRLIPYEFRYLMYNTCSNTTLKNGHPNINSLVTLRCYIYVLTSDYYSNHRKQVCMKPVSTCNTATPHPSDTDLLFWT